MNKVVLVSLCSVLMLVQPAYANCDKGWEATTLARTSSNHLLVSDKNIQHGISAGLMSTLVDVHKRINVSSGMYTRLIICNAEETNAFAWKAGNANMIGITLGMIKLLGTDSDAYASLIGHENAHLVFNHGHQREQRSVGLGILQLLVGTALEVVIQKDLGIRGLGSDLSSIGRQALSSSYSRDDERESDKWGVVYAYKAGFDPRGAIRMHQNLATTSNFLSTHPSSEDRINRLQNEIAALAVSNRTDQPTPPASNTYASTDNLIKRSASGVGQVLKVDPRLGYFVAAQTGLHAPVPGMRVEVVSKTGSLTGKIQRVVDGYFSVITDQPIKSVEVGMELKYE